MNGSQRFYDGSEYTIQLQGRPKRTNLSKQKILLVKQNLLKPESLKYRKDSFYIQELDKYYRDRSPDLLSDRRKSQFSKALKLKQKTRNEKDSLMLFKKQTAKQGSSERQRVSRKQIRNKSQLDQANNISIIEKHIASSGSDSSGTFLAISNKPGLNQQQGSHHINLNTIDLTHRQRAQSKKNNGARKINCLLQKRSIGSSQQKERLKTLNNSSDRIPNILDQRFINFSNTNVYQNTTQMMIHPKNQGNQARYTMYDSKLRSTAKSQSSNRSGSPQRDAVYESVSIKKKKDPMEQIEKMRELSGKRQSMLQSPEDLQTIHENVNPNFLQFPQTQVNSPKSGNLLQPHHYFAGSTKMQTLKINNNTNNTINQFRGTRSLTRQLSFNKINKQTEYEKRLIKNIVNKTRPDQFCLLKKMYDKIDEDDSGTITGTELKKVLYDVENGEALFDCLLNGDIDGDGLISFDEFLMCAVDFNIFTSDFYLKMAFEHFDKDGNGHICHEELKELLVGEVCASQNFELSPEDVEEAMEEFTGDKDQLFTFEHFKALMLKTMKRHQTTKLH